MTLHSIPPAVASRSTADTYTAVRGFYESLGFEVEERLSMGMHIR